MSRKMVHLTPDMHLLMAAYHEASHIVAGAREGARVVGAVLNFDGGLGPVVKGSTLFYRIADLPVASRSRINMAGPAGQAMGANRKLYPVPFGWAALVQYHVDDVRKDGGDAAEATRDARTILTREWATVDRVAKALYAANALNEETILQLVNS